MIPIAMSSSNQLLTPNVAAVPHRQHVSSLHQSQRWPKQPPTPTAMAPTPPTDRSSGTAPHLVAEPTSTSPAAESAESASASRHRHRPPATVQSRPSAAAKGKSKAKLSSHGRSSRSRSPHGISKKYLSPNRGAAVSGGFFSRSRRAMVAAWVKVTRLGGSLLGGSSSSSASTESRSSPAVEKSRTTEEEKARGGELEPVEETGKTLQEAVVTDDKGEPAADPESGTAVTSGDKTDVVADVESSKQVEDADADNSTKPAPEPDSTPALLPEPTPTEPTTTLLDILHIDPIWHRLALTYLPPHTVTRLRRVCRYLHDQIDHSLPVTHWLPTTKLRQQMIHSLCAAGYQHTTLLARLVPRTPNGILARASRTAWPALAAAVRGKHVATVEALLKLDPSGGAVGKLICPPPRALTSKGLQKVSVLSDAAARSDVPTLRALLAGAKGSSADHWIPVPGKGNVLKSALMCAIEAGNVPTAQALRELGAGWAPKSMVARPRPERRRDQRGRNVDGEDEVLDAQMGAVCIGLAVLSGSLAMLKWVLLSVHRNAVRTRPPWAYRLALLENMTPLMLAVTSDSLEMVQAMLAAGAPAVMPEDAKDLVKTPDAASLGGEKVHKALQSMPAWVFSNPVDLATTKKSRAPVFKLLVEAHRKQALGKVVHKCSFYQSDYKAAAAAAAASSSSSGHKLVGVMAPPMHESFLACAVRRGNVAMVQAVLDMGAQVSVPGRPWVKPEAGSSEEHCPIANYRYAALDDCDAMGYFLLCLAVKGGHDEVAEVLRAHLDRVSGGVAKIPWNMHVPDAPEPAPAVASADAHAVVEPPGSDAAAPRADATPGPEDASAEPNTDQATSSDVASTSDSNPSPSKSQASTPAISPLHGEPLYGKTPLHLVLERPVAQWDDAGISRMLDEGAWMHILDDQGYAPLDIAVRGAGVHHEIVKRMVGMLCESSDKVAAGFATLSVLIHASVIDASRGEMSADVEKTLKGLLAARPVECQEDDGKPQDKEDKEDGQTKVDLVPRQSEEVRKRFGGVSQVAGMVDAGLLPVDVELQNFPMYLEKDPFSPIPSLMEPPVLSADGDASKADKANGSEEAEKKADGETKDDDDNDDDDSSSLCSGCGRRHGTEKKDKTKPPTTPQKDIDLSLPFYAGLATPLFRAVVARNMHLVRLLLKHGAHPNLGLEHAHLSWAAQRNHVSSTIRSPLAQAVYMGDLDLVRELLSHGAAMREGEYDLTQCSVSPKHEKNSTCRVTVLLIALYLRAVARDLEDEANPVQEDQPEDTDKTSNSGPSTPSRMPLSKSPLLLATNQPPPAVLPPLPSVVRTPPLFAHKSGSSSASLAPESTDTTSAFTFTPASPAHVISFASPPQPPSTPSPPSKAISQFLTPTSVLESTKSSSSSPLATPSTTPLAHTSISLVAPPASAIPRLTDAVKRYNLTVAQLDAIIAELRARGAPITWNRLPCPRLCRKSEQFRLVRGDELNDTVKCAEECMRHTTESLTEKLKPGASGDKGKRAKARSRKVSSGRGRVPALPPASLPSVGSEAADADVPPMVTADGSALPLLTSAAVGTSAPFAFSFSWANEPSTAASSSTSVDLPVPSVSLFGGFGGSASGFSFKYTPATVEVDGTKVPLPASPVMGGTSIGSAASPTLLAVLDIPLPPSPMLGAVDDA
ncbi:hypothetical protein BCR44DRAFT_1436745 [Catenaria anguillulae PL171]|uniref:Uncharacterized protein n=1 Tax=Catenaria anguillulae PL171 TaxID=765915 RepID=A0A1Y2HHZ7_9FUNG|nr:hypothetical protein BCR44DRAFT_1436745 [Catenaria anguillulae PL171]